MGRPKTMALLQGQVWIGLPTGAIEMPQGVAKAGVRGAAQC